MPIKNKSAMDSEAWIGFTKQVVTSGASMSLDWRKGNDAYLNLAHTGATIDFTDPEDSGHCTLLIKHSGAGRTITTWDSKIKWAGGAAPTLSNGDGKIDVISFYYDKELDIYCGMATVNFA